MQERKEDNICNMQNTYQAKATSWHFRLQQASDVLQNSGIIPKFLKEFYEMDVFIIDCPRHQLLSTKRNKLAASMNGVDPDVVQGHNC